MNYKVIILGVLLLATVACSAESTDDTVRFGQLCIPPEYVVDTAFSDDLAGDPGFDKEGDREGPSLFFAADVLESEVAGYSGSIPVDEQTEHTQALHVALSISAVQSHQADSSRLRPLADETGLYTDSDEDKFGWRVYAQGNDDYRYWGNCYDNFSGGLNCRRSLSVDQYRLEYTVDGGNLSAYAGIDRFLENRLREWQCGGSDVGAND